MKRNNILKALALILLASALIVSCDGSWQVANSSTGSIMESATVLSNLTYEYTVTNEAEFLAALDSAVAGTNTVITVADSIIFTGSGTSVSGSDGSSYVYLIEITENYNILINFADDSYFLSVEAYANTVDSTTTLSSFKGNDTSDYRTLFYVNGGSLGINGGIVGGTLENYPLSRAVLVDAGGVFASNETTFRTYSNNFGSTICVLSGTGYIYDSKIYTTNRGLTINGSEASATLDGGTIISSVATYKTNSYLNAYGSYCVVTTEGKLYSYDATILARRGAFSTNGGQTYLYEGTNVYVGTKYVTSTDGDENMLADQKTWYNQWTGNTDPVYYAIYCAGEVKEGAFFYIYGGTYESEGTTSTIYIGNRNLPDDGGEGFSAYTVISGGEFVNSTTGSVLFVSGVAVESDGTQYGAGSVSISGGTFTITSSSNSNPVLYIEGEAVITGGTFTTSGSGAAATVIASSTKTYNFTDYTIPAGNLTISGGTYTTGDAYCISSAGTTNISDGTFTNNSSSYATINITAGTTTITGGTFTNSGSGDKSSVSGGTLTDSGNLVTSST